VTRFEHSGLQAGFRQVCRSNKTVMSGSDDDGVVGTGRVLTHRLMLLETDGVLQPLLS
jgi:hypothetical protein